MLAHLLDWYDLTFTGEGIATAAMRCVKTTIPFHRQVLANEQFRAGEVSTDFLEHFEYPGEAREAAAVAAG